MITLTAMTACWMRMDCDEKSDDTMFSSSEPKHASGAKEHHDELDRWQFRLLHKGEKHGHHLYHNSLPILHRSPGWMLWGVLRMGRWRWRGARRRGCPPWTACGSQWRTPQHLTCSPSLTLRGCTCLETPGTFDLPIVIFVGISWCFIFSDSGRTKIQPSWWWGSCSTGGTTTRYQPTLTLKQFNSHLVQLFLWEKALKMIVLKLVLEIFLRTTKLREHLSKTKRPSEKSAMMTVEEDQSVRQTVKTFPQQLAFHLRQLEAELARKPESIFSELHFSWYLLPWSSLNSGRIFAFNQCNNLGEQFLVHFDPN